MVKQPVPGQSKTRLVPPLKETQAADLAEALLLDSVALGAGLAGIDLALAVSPPEACAYFAGVTPPGALLLPVEGEHIGAVLDQVLTRVLAMGYRKALAFNGDGPSTPPHIFTEAETALDWHDLVYGPSEDGGFYLVGLTRPQPGLFYEVAWSTPQVMEESLGLAERAGLSVVLLSEWYDVDTVEDIERLRGEAAELEQLAHCSAYFERYDC